MCGTSHIGLRFRLSLLRKLTCYNVQACTVCILRIVTDNLKNVRQQNGCCYFKWQIAKGWSHRPVLGARVSLESRGVSYETTRNQITSNIKLFLVLFWHSVCVHGYLSRTFLIFEACLLITFLISRLPQQNCWKVGLYLLHCCKKLLSLAKVLLKEAKVHSNEIRNVGSSPTYLIQEGEVQWSGESGWG